MKKVNKKMLKKALADEKAIRRRRNYAIIYFDCDDGEVWTNEYIDCYSETLYRSSSIVLLGTDILGVELKGGLHPTFNDYVEWCETMMKRYAEIQQKPESEE